MATTHNGVTYRGLVRTEESAGRRSRTLKLDDKSAQVQAKEARIDEETRYLQVRYWTDEAGWTHLVIDPAYPGISGIIAVGADEASEQDSWDKAREQARAAGVEL